MMGMFISYELETGVRELRCELSHWNMFKNLRDPLRCVSRSDAGPMDVNATGTLGGRRSSTEDARIEAP